MPDKKTDWTSDETFWNDAWTDMNQRLDRQRRRRVLIPWLLGLGLFLGAGALGIYLTGNVSPATSPTAPFAGESAVTDPESPSRPLESDLTQPEKVVGGETPTRSGSGTAAGTANSLTAVPEKQPAELDPALSITSDRPSPAPRPPVPPADYDAAIVGLLPPAVFGLEGALPLELPTVTLPAEAPSFRAKPQPGPYVLAAGATGYVNSFLPGGYLQFGREFGKGNWFVPVALRYDYSRRKISVGRDQDLAEALNLTQMDIVSNFSSVLDTRLGLNRNALIKTHTVALRTGVGRRFSPRFSVATGGEVSYLIGGSGPLIINPGNGNYSGLRVEDERLRFSNLSGSSAMRSAYYQGDQTISDDIHKILANAWLLAQYRIGANFGLQVGITHQLTRFYRTDAFRVEATRIELGLLRRF